MGGSPGVQTIRCCSTGAMLPEGCDEMVIDLFRNNGNDSNTAETTQISNPMSRFDDGWETKYVAAFQKKDRETKRSGVGGGEGGGQRSEVDLSKTSDGLAPWDRLW